MALQKGTTLHIPQQLDLDVLEQVYPPSPTTGRSLYKVRNRGDGLIYALKLFDLSLNNGDEIRREMVALNRQLNHPEHFPRYRNYTEREGTGHLLIDWLDGVTLQQKFGSQQPKGPHDVKERLNVLVEICGTLLWLHKAGHIHRDLKPQNVLLREAHKASAGVALIDFGLAAARRRAIEGSSGFQAPEQIERPDFPLDQRTDIFAVGALGWWLMAGTAFPAVPDDDGGWRNAESGCLRALSPAVTDSVEEALLLALRFEPKQRPGSAADLKARLQNAGRRI